MTRFHRDFHTELEIHMYSFIGIPDSINYSTQVLLEIVPRGIHGKKWRRKPFPSRSNLSMFLVLDWILESVKKTKTSASSCASLSSADSIAYGHWWLRRRNVPLKNVTNTSGHWHDKVPQNSPSLTKAKHYPNMTSKRTQKSSIIWDMPRKWIKVIFFSFGF